MEEIKYYTPSIDEFYVGFEFEHRDPYYDGREEFQKAIIKSDDLVIYPDEDGMFNYFEAEHLLSNILYDITKNNVRVKYLDKEDLIELGFEYMEDVGDCINFTKYIQESNRSINLTLHRNSRRVGVAVHDLNVKSPMTSIQIGTFGGEIKNKSELIKVLKMLGIK